MIENVILTDTSYYRDKNIFNFSGKVNGENYYVMSVNNEHDKDGETMWETIWDIFRAREKH